LGVVDRYNTAADLPTRIPVFPLRGAILLPRSSLPLNVFEPRYLEMLDDVVSGGRVIGIVQPVETTVGSESPAGKAVELKRIGCTGRVTAFQELDDGRLLITVTGIARFELIGEVQTSRPYRTCTVDHDRFVRDFKAGHGEDDVDREKLLKVLKLYLERRQLRSDWRAITNATTEFLVNSLSVISPYGPEEKQALLEAPTLAERADVLMTLAQMDLASGEGGSGTTLQ
jgi:hypothetical protein